MVESTESNLLTLVKPWSTLVITPKTEATITNDPVNKVNTPWWSKLGQNPGQNPYVFELPPELLSHSPNFTETLQNFPI
jgi:hypothetical protein